MKARYRPNDNLEIEIEAASVKDLFKQLAEVGETFGVQKCGHCKSDDIYFIVRTVDGNNFPEMKCRKCKFKLAFGQSKDGKSIYPRLRFHKVHPEVKARRAEEGSYIPNEGWEKFSVKDDEE